MRNSLLNARLSGGLTGDFEDGRLVRLWARAGKHRIEFVDKQTIFSLGITQDDLDERTANVFAHLCSQCGRRTDFEWELTPAPRDRMLCPECTIRRRISLDRGIHRMLGDSEYLVIRVEKRETLYPIGTPNTVFARLEEAARAKERVKVAYGDPITGRDWQLECKTSGYVARSVAGVALLVYNARSFGGSPLLANHIVQIKAARGGRVLYEHPNYHPAEG